MTRPIRSLADRLRAFALLCLQLSLVLWFVYLFEIEERTYCFAMLCVAAGGFVVHAWLQRRFQIWCFVAISLAGIVFVLGLADGLKLIAIGLALIAICHLPVPLFLRAVILAVAGGVLAGLRVDYPKEPFWPVLASMFMFRLIVYLFELGHGRARGAPGADTPGSVVSAPSSVALTLAYFFPLPNVSFLLFPVLDFQTFRATYFDDDDYEIYQRGIAWMVRGLSHLVAYRVIKYYLLPAPYQLRDAGHLMLYIAGTYALYLWVSGSFHLITGVLHLFGFDVPRTHDNYFLASSVSDIWRRINIYWKDFMTKVFFFPAFFALRRLGTRLALGGATLIVFLATWALHSYQMFWLAGDLPLSANVAGLWLGAGVLVAVSLQFDLLRSRTPVRVRGPESLAVWPAAIQSLRVLRTFTLVSLFWAGWTDPKFFGSLREIVGGLDHLAGAIFWLVGGLSACVAGGVLAQWLWDRYLRDLSAALSGSFSRSAAWNTAVLWLALVASLPQIGGLFGASTQEVVATLRQDAPTLLEAGQAMRGYYEEIAVTHVQAGPFLRRLTTSETLPEGAGHYSHATQPADDPLLGRVLIPGWHGQLGSAQASFNQLGMRDRQEITMHKPANTCRIALVGSSIVMGYGVEDGEVFKVLLEEKLNSQLAPGRPRVELLNFGLGLSTSINRLRLIERKVFDFEPDALFYFAHQDELYSAAQFMPLVVQNKMPMPYPILGEVVRKSGVNAQTRPDLMERMFMPFSRELTLGLYRILAEECRKRGIPLVWIYLPMPGISRTPAEASAVIDVAREAGFQVLDLSGWSAGFAPAEVKLGREDQHPNPQGHRIIAERLFAELKKRPELLPKSVQLAP